MSENIGPVQVTILATGEAAVAYPSEHGYDYQDAATGTVTRFPGKDHEPTIIPVEHRPAVALALLGGITDELVEKAAVGAAKARMENPDMGRSWGDDRRFEARCIINAVFGIEQP